MIVGNWFQRTVVVWLPAVFGCATCKPAMLGPVATSAPEAAQSELPLTMDEIKAGLNDLPVWPHEQRDFSVREWLQVVDFARQLQRTDAEVVLAALREYVRVPSEENPSMYVGKWTQVYILLRVLFDVPSERYDKHKHSLPPISGGGFWPAFRSRRECERLESVLSRPILWTKQRPRLFSSFVGYNGKPYNVDVEWAAYRETYKYRNLDATVRMLRAKVRADKGTQLFFKGGIRL